MRNVDHEYRGGLCFELTFHNLEIFFGHEEIINAVVDLRISKGVRYGDLL